MNSLRFRKLLPTALATLTLAGVLLLVAAPTDYQPASAFRQAAAASADKPNAEPAAFKAPMALSCQEMSDPIANLLLISPFQAQNRGGGTGDKNCKGTIIEPPSPDGRASAELFRGEAGTPILRIMVNGDKLPLKDNVWGKITNAKPGDRVWMDSFLEGSKTWVQCGPFTVENGKTSAVTRNAYWGAFGRKGHWVRVCGDRKGRKHNCSIWYQNNPGAECNKPLPPC
jgi:hypothetical protein